MPNADMLDTVAYLRVSKEEQATADKTSLAHQRHAITAKAGQMGRTVGRVFADPGYSGGTANRPDFLALLAFCEAHPRPATTPGVVLVYNDSRWGRFPNPEEGAYWRVHLLRFGWRVRYVEGDDSDDITVSSLLRALHGSQATVYRETIRKNARQGARGTAERGYWGVEAPIGYRRMAIDQQGRTRVLDVGQRKGDGERVRLTPGPEPEVALIRWLFTTYAEGAASLGRLVDAAEARWPAKRWSKPVVGALLRNRAYAGDVVWMRRTADPLERAHGMHRDPSQWVVTRDAHPPLVERALFDRVQALLTRNRTETSPTAGGYPLTGLIHCAHCGHPYIGGGGRKGPPTDPDRYRFYRDSAVDRRHPCPGPIGTVTKRILERLVYRTVAQVVSRPSVVAEMAAGFAALIASVGEDAVSRRAHLITARDRAHARRDRLLRLVASGTATEAEAAAVLAECRVQIDTATSALDQLRGDDHRTHHLTAERDRVLALARDFAAQMERMDGNGRRALIRPWIEGATLDKQKRTLTMAIRLLPVAHDVIGWSGWPGLDRQADSTGVIRRTITLPRRGRGSRPRAPA